MMKIKTMGLNGREYQAAYDGPLNDSNRAWMVGECIESLHRHMQKDGEDWDDAPITIVL